MAKANPDTLKERAKYFATAFELIAAGQYAGAQSDVVLKTLKWLDKEHTKVVTRIKKLEPTEVVAPDAVIEPPKPKEA